ncbi:hypothetical protein [Flavobacterium sp. 3HN19-14]|uniref:hypothetical protein n=1 Tax=Flavobacterium sp. 3HN19-14 TaxID=3448133 RepID=UPI003EE3FB40
MDFDAFLALVPKIIEAKLPDDVSHQKMAPLERMEIMKNLDLEKANPRKAAVMMLFYPKNKKAHLVSYHKEYLSRRTLVSNRIPRR